MKEFDSLIHNGFSDASLPNTLGTGKWTSGDLFVNVQSSPYWSSTTYVADAIRVWLAHMLFGVVHDNNGAPNVHVWPVRGPE